MTPDVSVLVSVHDGGRFLERAVRSVLDQTYRGFELVLIDDGSTDSTGEIVDRLALEDARIVRVHQARVGLTRALNVGLRLTRGRYVARQDADDVSVPRRLERQVAFLERNEDCWVVGCAYDRVNEAGDRIARVSPPTSDLGIRLRLLRENCIPHSGATLRRDRILEMGGYDERCETAQDYDLWCRIALRGRLANLPEVGLLRREHPHRVGAHLEAEQTRTRDRIRARYRAEIASGAGRRDLASWIVRVAARRTR